MMEPGRFRETGITVSTNILQLTGEACSPQITRLDSLLTKRLQVAGLRKLHGNIRSNSKAPIRHRAISWIKQFLL